MKFAYLAGYIDGDGSVCVRTYLQKNTIKVYESSLQICSVDYNSCTYFFEEFGGAMHKRPEKRANRRDTWLWYVKGKECKQIIEKCISFFVLKDKSCLLCNKLIENITNTRSFRGNPVSNDTHTFRETIINQIKEEIHMNDRVSEKNFHSLKELKTIKTPSNADLAYLAGFIDAEGCFRIQHWQPKRKGRNETWVIALEIGNTKFPIFPWLIERFGGNVIYRKPKNDKHNPMIIWSLKSDALYQLLPKVYPYLRSKKERAEKLGQFHQTSVMLGGDRNSEKFKNHICDILVTKRALYDEFQILNAKGKH